MKINILKIAIGFNLAMIAAAIILGIGWIINIIKIIGIISDPITAMFIARCVGVIAFPLGGILGFV